MIFMDTSWGNLFRFLVNRIYSEYVYWFGIGRKYEREDSERGAAYVHQLIRNVTDDKSYKLDPFSSHSNFTKFEALFLRFISVTGKINFYQGAISGLKTLKQADFCSLTVMEDLMRVNASLRAGPFNFDSWVIVSFLGFEQEFFVKGTLDYVKLLCDFTVNSKTHRSGTFEYLLIREVEGMKLWIQEGLGLLKVPVNLAMRLVISFIKPFIRNALECLLEYLIKNEFPNYKFPIEGNITSDLKRESPVYLGDDSSDSEDSQSEAENIEPITIGEKTFKASKIYIRVSVTENTLKLRRVTRTEYRKKYGRNKKETELKNETNCPSVTASPTHKISDYESAMKELQLNGYTGIGFKKYYDETSQLAEEIKFSSDTLKYIANSLCQILIDGYMRDERTGDRLEKVKLSGARRNKFIKQYDAVQKLSETIYRSLNAMKHVDSLFCRIAIENYMADESLKVLDVNRRTSVYRDGEVVTRVHKRMADVVENETTKEISQSSFPENFSSEINSGETVSNVKKFPDYKQFKNKELLDLDIERINALIEAIETIDTILNGRNVALLKVLKVLNDVAKTYFKLSQKNPSIENKKSKRRIFDAFRQIAVKEFVRNRGYHRCININTLLGSNGQLSDASEAEVKPKGNENRNNTHPELVDLMFYSSMMPTNSSTDGIGRNIVPTKTEKSTTCELEAEFGKEDLRQKAKTEVTKTNKEMMTIEKEIRTYEPMDTHLDSLLIRFSAMMSEHSKNSNDVAERDAIFEAELGGKKIPSVEKAEKSSASCEVKVTTEGNKIKEMSHNKAATCERDAAFRGENLMCKAETERMDKICELSVSSCETGVLSKEKCTPEELPFEAKIEHATATNESADVTVERDGKEMLLNVQKDVICEAEILSKGCSSKELPFKADVEPVVSNKSPNVPDKRDGKEKLILENKKNETKENFFWSQERKGSQPRNPKSIPEKISPLKPVNK